MAYELDFYDLGILRTLEYFYIKSEPIKEAFNVLFPCSALISIEIENLSTHYNFNEDFLKYCNELKQEKLDDNE